MAQQVTRRPYVRTVSRTRWFFRQPRYMRYMAREVTCIFIGAYTILLIVALAQLAAGSQAWDAFLQRLQSAPSIVFHVLALGFALYHSFTWFNLAPKAMPVQIGESFMPGSVIAGAHYLGFALLSGAILYWAGAL